MTGDDTILKKSVEEKVLALEKKIDRQEFKIFLAGRYDKLNAILEIFRERVDKTLKIGQQCF